MAKTHQFSKQETSNALYISSEDGECDSVEVSTARMRTHQHQHRVMGTTCSTVQRLPKITHPSLRRPSAHCYIIDVASTLRCYRPMANNGGGHELVGGGDEEEDCGGIGGVIKLRCRNVAVRCLLWAEHESCGGRSPFPSTTIADDDDDLRSPSSLAGSTQRQAQTPHIIHRRQVLRRRRLLRGFSVICWAVRLSLFAWPQLSLVASSQNIKKSSGFTAVDFSEIKSTSWLVFVADLYYLKTRIVSFNLFLSVSFPVFR